MKFRLRNHQQTKKERKELLELLKIAKSSYCYQESLLNDPDKYGNLKIEVVKIFKDSNETYGYRRIHSEIKKQGIIISEK